MSNETDGLVSLTQPVIMSFPNLYEARAIGPRGKEQGKPKYSANFVFAPDHPDLKTLKPMAARIALAKWPGRDLKTLKFPFFLGDKLADKAKAKDRDGEYQRGKIVLVSRSQYEPRLCLIENGKLIELDGPARVAAKAKFYFGVHVLAQFNFVAYDGVGQNPDGVTAYLNMVVSLNTGERIGGGPSAAEVFKGYVGTVSAEDPTAGAGLDDAISF